MLSELDAAELVKLLGLQTSLAAFTAANEIRDATHNGEPAALTHTQLDALRIALNAGASDESRPSLEAFRMALDAWLA